MFPITTNNKQQQQQQNARYHAGQSNYPYRSQCIDLSLINNNTIRGDDLNRRKRKQYFTPRSLLLSTIRILEKANEADVCVCAYT